MKRPADISWPFHFAFDLSAEAEAVAIRAAGVEETRPAEAVKNRLPARAPKLALK